MPAVARFDLKMDAEEKEKANELLDRESSMTMTSTDFQAFTSALDGTFTPNAALQNAMKIVAR